MLNNTNNIKLLAKFQPLDNKRINTILNNEIHLSDPRDFNDPLEFQVIFDKEIDEEFEKHEDKYKESAFNFYTDSGLSITRSHYIYSESIKTFSLNQFKICCFSDVGTIGNDGTYLETNIESLQRSKKITEDIKHWTIYGDYGKGFCAIYGVDKMKLGKDYKILYKHVKHVIEPPLITKLDIFEGYKNDYSEVTEKLISYKSNCWETENEIRLVVLKEDWESRKKNIHNGLDLRLIVFGYSVTPEVIKNVISRFIKNKKLYTRFAQVKLQSNSYKLKFTEIKYKLCECCDGVILAYE